MDDFSDIAPPPPANTMLTAMQLQSGPPIDPLTRILTYTADDWEKFIDEWATHGLKKPKYKAVKRFSGSNDRGIDIAGFMHKSMLKGAWDNYQCKHYDHPLHPGDAWPEIGKILWHSFKGHYVPPRAYYFVAPRECGTTLSQYLANAPVLKAKVLEVWDANIREHITKTQPVPLEGAFAVYVNAFDFSIFQAKTVREIIEQHKATPYFLSRFGGGLPPRPKPGAPPVEIDDVESGYITKLLVAYSERLQKPVTAAAELTQKLAQHFRRQREAFYHAESLRVFVRDKVEAGTFENLQDEIYKGIIDTRDAAYSDQLERLVAVTDRAQILPLTAHPLVHNTFAEDKHGICHQLANDERITWTE
ncbi:MAG: ABC-three component system protein [Rhizomicrobium sp.]